ncbi:hypothetical protein Tco_0954242 [Tanacetum coccineum]|uniref:Uncharacterized protein n=1 Tax=Tanacetum coccineum TaxID=301880 RepID=A0ABQ5E3M3_9ASTR
MVLHQRGFGSLPSSTEVNPRDQVKSISTTIEADSYPIRRELAYAKLIVELADKIVKYPKGIAENVLVARLMGETLVINRSLDPLNEDYIELNDLNEPFELRRNQGDDLMPTITEGEVIEEFKTRDDELDTGIDDYPRALMNVPIFVGTFSVVTDFTVLEDMDDYHDEGMGDVIFGEPFLREVGIKARRFESDLTFTMVSDEDKKNGISHPYQKLKGFYKGVLNLGPDYIRDAKTEEWLIREHISVHEMEW